MKRWLILLLFLLAAPAAAADCVQPSSRPCAIVDSEQPRLRPGINIFSRTVSVPQAALPLERPLTVRIAALASSEVQWNGRTIGTNGVPGETRASERPGRYFAIITVPNALVRAGDNVVTVRMSAEHLWAPVYRPVHMLAIGPYETPELPGRSHYLPALLALGAIAAAFLYFAVAAVGRGPRRDRTALMLAGLAGTVMLQLLVEVSRAFIAYDYPAHLARVSAISVLAAASAVLMAAYVAERFAPDRRRAILLGTALVAMACVVLVPGFDFKAVGAIVAGVVVVSLCALRGIQDGTKGGRAAMLVSIAALLLMLWQPSGFLDQGYYLLMAAALMTLVAEQVGALRSARVEAARAKALEARLCLAEAQGEPIVQLKDGSRVHRVAQADILFARGADDYCEVRLKDGRILLVTSGLARLQVALPAGFVRVHKSYVVNRDHVRRLEPRPGGGRLLRLEGEVTVPVGRSYGSAVSAWAAG